MRNLLVLLLLVVNCAMAGNGEARRFFRQARRAERRGDVKGACLLYCRAAGEDPTNPLYWLRCKTLADLSGVAPGNSGSQPAKEQDRSENPAVTEAGLAEALRPLPPWELKASEQRKDLDFQGTAQTLFALTARAYGLEAVFDSEYQPGAPFRFQLTNVGYREALRALELATGSFIIPLSEKLFLVAKDTAPKRAELEPNVSVALPIPSPVSLQEAQDLVRSVQQAMNLTRFNLDSQRRILVIRDRISKVLPAIALIHRLLRYSAQVMIQVDFLEVNATSSVEYGSILGTNFPLVNFSSFWRSTPTVPQGFSRFVGFGGGDSFLGVGVTDAGVMSTGNQSDLHTLLSSAIRTVDNKPATLHVGERYPVLSAAFLGQVEGQQYAIPPVVNFEDLGLILKLTPHLHDARELSLDIDAEFKVLTGESNNGIPVISSRKLQSTVRLREGEWAIVAGLIAGSLNRRISGPAGLSSIPLIGPLFRRNSRDAQMQSVILVLKPNLVYPPAVEKSAPSVWVGSENRPVTPL